MIRGILGQEGPPADYRALPRVTFTDPEIGSVGLHEHAARQAGVNIRGGTTPMPGTAHGWIHKTGNEGLVKLIEDTTAACGGAMVIGPLTRWVPTDLQNGPGGSVRSRSGGPARPVPTRSPSEQ